MIFVSLWCLLMKKKILRYNYSETNKYHSHKVRKLIITGTNIQGDRDRRDRSISSVFGLKAASNCKHNDAIAAICCFNSFSQNESE